MSLLNTHEKRLQRESEIFFLGYLMTPSQLHIFMSSNGSMTMNNEFRNTCNSDMQNQYLKRGCIIVDNKPECVLHTYENVRFT